MLTKVMRISVLDYGVGNFASVSRMVARVGGRANVISTCAELTDSTVLVLPGVGSFDYAVAMLRERRLDDGLRDFVADPKNVLIGICLGMQLLFGGSEEGKESGLGLVQGFVTQLKSDERDELPVPHMGWNTVKPVGTGGFLPTELGDLRFYFAHSYKVELADKNHQVGSTTYGSEFCAAFADGNIHGYQFHPEKSHRFGLALFRNIVGT